MKAWPRGWNPFAAIILAALAVGIIWTLVMFGRSEEKAARPADASRMNAAP